MITLTSVDTGNKCDLYDRIIELRLQDGVLDFGASGGSCGYATVLPISPLEYRRRKNYCGCAKITVEVTPYCIKFNLTDDWGKAYVVIVDGELMDNPIVRRELDLIRKLENEDGRTNELLT